MVLTQKEMMKRFLPILEKSGKTYKKVSKVKARPAKVGEKIDTHTEDGKETTNTAKEGDYVVQNMMTASREKYIISSQKLKDRYTHLGHSNGPWELYQAKGEVLAIKYDPDDFDFPKIDRFAAAWEETMKLMKGDMLCTTIPAKDEIYRIAAKEFASTYVEKTGG